MRRVAVLLLAAVGLRRLYRLVAHGALTLDTGIGRTIMPLGPVHFTIAAPREVVFDVIASPYLGRTPRSLQSSLEVWEHGQDMVLAAHSTPVRCGVTTTVETVRFTSPERIDFHVVRGPVPHVIEAFELEEHDSGTMLTWHGELGTDIWALGNAWGGFVARHWERAVRRSVAHVAAEAERRA